MPSGMAGLDAAMPDVGSNASTEEKLQEIYSYLFLLLGNLKYLLSNLGMENFNDAEMDSLKAPIYKSIDDLNGHVLNVQATAEGAQVTATNAVGAAATAQITADGAQVTASNALGKAQTVSLTVDGLRIANETKSYTIIDGDKLTSKDNELGWGGKAVIENGNLKIYRFNTQKLFVGVNDQFSDAVIQGGTLYLLGNLWIGGNSTQYNVNLNANALDMNSMGDIDIDSWSRVLIDSGGAMKLNAGGNTSIDAGGTVYIGTSGVGCQVDIGATGNDIHINGNVYINGELFTGAASSSGDNGGWVGEAPTDSSSGGGVYLGGSDNDVETLTPLNP